MNKDRFNKLWGDQLYQKRAREAFPLLVRQAILGNTIFYSDLAKELKMPNPRNLNYVLGCIGETLKELSSDYDKPIPQIQCIVVNKTNQLPGDGIAWFISQSDFNKFDNKKKREILKNHLRDIYAFPQWLKVLSDLGLKQPAFTTTRLSNKYKSGGESQDHKNLKEYVAKNPKLIGLPANCNNGEIEFSLPSGDSVDVMFSYKSELIAVEVKSKISDSADIQRGMFQCVKYQAVSEAMLGVEGKPQNVRSVLILESEFPQELIPMKNMLGVEVIDMVRTES